MDLWYDSIGFLILLEFCGAFFEFCGLFRRARALGYGIWMDLKGQLTHHGDVFAFKGDVSSRFWAT